MNDEIQNDKFISTDKIIYKGIGIFKGEFIGQSHKGKGTIYYEDDSTYEENGKILKDKIMEFFILIFL